MVRLPLVDQVIAFVRKGPAAPRRVPVRDERLRIAFEQSPVAIAIATTDGQWYATNERFRKLAGYSREELARISLHSLTHPDDAKKEMPLLRKMREGDLDSYRLDKRLMGKDGHYRALDVLVGVIRDAAGEPDAFILIADEPQVQKRHEPVRAAERALAAIVEQITDVAIIRTDEKGTIHGWNAGATQLFGYTRDEMLGKNRRMLYRDADSWDGNATRHLQNVAEDGRITLEDWRVARDGNHLWVKSTLSALKTEGAVRGYVETVTAPAAAKTIDTTPLLEQLRAEVEKGKRTEQSLREAFEHMRMTGEETMNELRIVTIALRKELDRRKTLEEELRQATEQLAATALPVAEEELVVSDVPTERVWTRLDATPPSELLLSIAAEERSGTLVIAGDRGEREIFFDKGRVFSCASNDPRHFLTQRLVERGWLTDEQRQRALEVRRETGLALGRILLILGAISEEQLIDTMRTKLEDEIAEVFDWRDARYVFLEGAVPSLQLVPLRIEVAPFVRDRLAARVATAVVASVKSRKVHQPSCRSAQRISGDARRPFASVDAAEAEGFERCRLCFR